MASIKDNYRNFAQGKGVVEAVNGQSGHAPGPFVRMIVIDVISDPTTIDDRMLNNWNAAHVVGVREYASSKNHGLPRNTLVVKEIQSDKPPELAFPFFPSHLSLPCQPGEMVWAMYESFEWNQENLIVPYWFCKISQPHFVDDVNHTHAPRVHETSYTGNLRDMHENDGKIDAFHEMRIAPVRTSKDGKVRSSAANARYINVERDDYFELLITQTDASNLKSYEAIPRFKKRPGDIAIEGSNNSLIVLGTDRNGKMSEYSAVSSPTIPKEDMQFSAGSIDLVVGRGQTTKTFGKEIETTRVGGADEGKKGPAIKKEINKLPQDVTPNEGDPDFYNDRSRILISQRTKTDLNFQLDRYNQDYGIADNVNGDPSVTIKSDKLRLIARADVEMLSTGFTDKKSPAGLPAGLNIKETNSDLTKWASIIVKESGDIIVSNAKNKIFAVGPNKDAMDPAKAMLTLDSEKKKVIIPLVEQGKAVVGSSEPDSALGVFDNGSHVITLGGGNPATALEVLDVDQKLVTIGTALGVFNVGTGAVSIGGGALMVAGPPGGSGAAPGLGVASAVAHAQEVKDIVTQITQCLVSLQTFAASLGAAKDPISLLAAAQTGGIAAGIIGSAIPAITARLSTLASTSVKIQ
jgi:hypothetical protein